MKKLKDEYLAQDALQETYILTLKNLSKLKDPTLVITWLNQINFRICHGLQKKQKLYESEMMNYNNVVTDDRHPASSNNPEAEVGYLYAGTTHHVDHWRAEYTGI